MALSALLLVIVLASPAGAHSSYQWLYWNGAYRGYGGVTSAHDYVYACDTLGEGKAVYTEYTQNGVNRRVYDGNGSASGCGWVYTSPAPTRYRVCLAVDYWVNPCTPWLST